MNKRKALPLLFLLPLLASCGTQEKNLSRDFQLFRNGDSAFGSVEESYNGYLNSLEVDYLIKEMDAGGSISVFLGSPTCHYCEQFKDTAISFLKENHADVTYINTNKSGNSVSSDNPGENIKKLREYFGTNAEYDEARPFLAATPTWYQAKKDNAKITAYGAVSASQLKTGFFYRGSLLDIYKFSSLDNVEKALAYSNAPVGLFDSSNSDNLSSYYSLIHPIAKEQDKSLYLIDLARVDDNDKSDILEYFNTSDSSKFLLKYNSLISSGDEAIKSLNDYYDK